MSTILELACKRFGVIWKIVISIANEDLNSPYLVCRSKMVRTNSGVGNVNEDRNQPPVVERVPIVVATPEPISMVGVQFMIQTMLDRQMDETRCLLRQNREELSMPIEQPEMNEGHSEGGNFSGIVGQANPPLVRQNNQDGGHNGLGCKYKEFLT